MDHDELDGPGVYGGPEEERIASADERARLKAAGWSETVMKTLWIPPTEVGGHLRNVDEALDLVAAGR